MRSFIQAVQETQTPYDLQKGVADRIIADFGPEPKPAKSGRTAFQAERKREDRFNAGNIRNRVVVEALNRTRSPRRKAEIKRIEQMTSLERALEDCERGMRRTASGFNHVLGVVEVMGGITESDMTPLAQSSLRKMLDELPAFEALLARLKRRKLLRSGNAAANNRHAHH